MFDTIRVADIGQSCREAARCSIRVADIGQSCREAARCSIRVADIGQLDVRYG